MKRTFFDDEDFQDSFLNTLIHDLPALRQLAPLLHENDFRPLEGMRYGRARWIVASCVLNYYHKYFEAPGRLLRSEVLAYAEETGLGERVQTELQNYLKLLRGRKLRGITATVERVTQFKKERMKAEALQRLVELQAAGNLTDESMYEICQEGLRLVSDGFQSNLYLDTVESRITKRAYRERRIHIPVFDIGPLDRLVNGVAAGGLGVVLAPTKRGKSLMLLWLARSFVLQRLTTGLFTLEDPADEVENRLDALISGLRIKNLALKERLFKKRFLRFRRLIRKHLLVIDGTQEGMTVNRIEEVFLRERDQGRRCDALIIDYDDEIKPIVPRKERRYEFADIYRDLRRLAAKHNLIIWTAAQTQRGTEQAKMLEARFIAEDIGKIRKCTMALGLGRGDWGPDSVYLWVTAHKFDKSHVGCNIMTDRTRMMIYDEEATRQKQREELEGEDELGD